MGSLINRQKLRDKVKIVNGDIADRLLVNKIVHEAKFRFIFNFAAYATVIEKAVENPYDTVMANTLGWVNIMEAARIAPFKPEVVFLSSTDKVYGEMTGNAYQEDSTPHLLRILVHLAADFERPRALHRSEEILHNGITVRVRISESKVIAIKNQHLDGNKLTLATGFVPLVEFKEGLRRTIESYDSYFASNRN